MNVWDIKSREHIPIFLESRGLKTGIEIGILRGEYSEILLRLWPSCEKLHLIDPWKSQDISSYNDINNLSDQEFEEAYQQTIERLKKFKSRYQIHRCMSKEIYFKFPKIDFIYIDGNHSYESVMEDLTHYYPRLNNGGIIAGHDFFNYNSMQVKKAVNEYFKSDVYIIPDDVNQCPSWLHIKS